MSIKSVLLCLPEIDNSLLFILVAYILSIATITLCRRRDKELVARP